MCERVCECRNLCSSLRRCLESSANPTKLNRSMPLGAGGWGLCNMLLSLSPGLFCEHFFPFPPFFSPSPALTPAVIAPLPSGPRGSCTHPARSDNASSPRPSAGRPCCSRNACGGGRSSASALTPISDTCEFPLSFPHPLSSQLRPPQPLPLGHP